MSIESFTKNKEYFSQQLIVIDQKIEQNTDISSIQPQINELLDQIGKQQESLWEELKKQANQQERVALIAIDDELDQINKSLQYCAWKQQTCEIQVKPYYAATNKSVTELGEKKTEKLLLSTTKVFDLRMAISRMYDIVPYSFKIVIGNKVPREDKWIMTDLYENRNEVSIVFDSPPQRDLSFSTQC